MCHETQFSWHNSFKKTKGCSQFVYQCAYQRSLIIIRKKLRADKTFHRRTNLSTDNMMELLDFVLSMTYFSYNGNIYLQIKGALMGSPVSVIVSNLFMEDHEETAITTAPPEMKLKIWRRYVDDSFEIIKKDKRDPVTEHLNHIDPTGSIKFTDEPEEEKTFPFIDAHISRKKDGTLKVKVCRKKTHTYQYLSLNPTTPYPTN